MTPDELLSWWFGNWDDQVPLADNDPLLVRWWQKRAETDQFIQERFGAIHADVAQGGRRDWEATAKGLLARVIVLDQFSRFVHRGTGKAFVNDRAARELTNTALERAWDRDLQRIERAFLYMPLMHAEDRVAHRRALSLFTGLAEEAEEAGIPRADFYRRLVGQAQSQKATVDRFGRFPQRNFPMERTSTPEELAFLRELDEEF